MGRASTISFEMVASTAEAMKAEGIAPTSRGVRERLGNTGSMGTVLAHMTTWLERQVQHVTNSLVLPPALQKAILDFMSVELASARQGLEAELAFKKKELADIGADNTKQFDEIEEKAEALELLRTEIATHQGKTEQLEKELAANKESVISERAKAHDDIEKEREAAEAARTELAKALLRLEAMPRLEADLNAARAALEAEKVASRLALDNERTAKVAAEQSAAVAMAKIESGNQRIQELTDRLGKAEAISMKMQEKIDAAAKEAITMNAAIQLSQARVESAVRDLDDVKKVATDAMAAAKKSGEEAAELRGTILQMKADTRAEKKVDKAG